MKTLFHQTVALCEIIKHKNDFYLLYVYYVAMDGHVIELVLIANWCQWPFIATTNWCQ